MAALKYSRQRQFIREYVMNSMEHPTADAVYAGIRNEFPNISLGTVYRNLSLLVELGQIRKISTGEGPDRFDCNIKAHSHFICTICHRITDIHAEEMNQVKERVAEGFDGELTGHMTTFYGICKECLDKKNLKKTS